MDLYNYAHTEKKMFPSGPLFLSRNINVLGGPFLPPLSVSTLIAGTALIRSPRGTRNSFTDIFIIVICY